MRPHLEWLVDLRQGLKALSGGRELTAWRQRLAQDLSGLADLSRASAWTDEFGGFPFALSSEPLWGRLLAVIAAQVAVAPGESGQDSVPSLAKSRSEMANQTSPVSKARAAASGRTSAHPHQVGHPAPDVPAVPLHQPLLDCLSSLPAKVGQSLLIRLAKDAAFRHLKATSSPRQAPSALPGRDQRDLHPSERAARPPARDDAVRLDQIFARRASHLLDFTAREAASSPVDRDEILGSAWKIPIGGPGVSTELLTWLADRRRTPGRAMNYNPQRHRGEEQVDREAEDRRLRAYPASPGGRENGGSTPYLPGRADRMNLSTEESSAPGSRRAIEAGLGRPGRGRHADLFALLGEPWAEPEVDCAPALSAGLPLPGPTQSGGAPIAPVAPVMIRAKALPEASAAEDDLSALAARIKRILDEEARRYGIDV